MGRHDVYHDLVKNALINAGWTITHDPLKLAYGEHKLFVDLGAEMIGAARDGQKIAVEIKSFLGDSEINDLQAALGQYLMYRSILEQTEPERELFLAVPQRTYHSVLTDQLGELIRREHHLYLIVFDEQNEVITEWTK